MIATITIEAYEFAKLGEEFKRLPAEMQRQVFGRAIGRSKSRVERAYSQLQSARIKVPQKLIKAMLRSKASGGELTLIVRSSQIPLHKLGAKQIGIFGMTTRASDFGVLVRGRGMYEEAFIASAKSKRAAGLVMRRSGSRSLPVKALFGPNPAGEIIRNPVVYEDMLGDIAQDTFAVEILRGVAFMIGRL